MFKLYTRLLLTYLFLQVTNTYIVHITTIDMDTIISLNQLTLVFIEQTNFVLYYFVN